MTSERCRVGLIGAGMISPYHLTGWSRLERAKVVAICDPDRARAEERAKAFGMPAVYTDAADDARARTARCGRHRLAARMPCRAMCGSPPRAALRCLCQKPLTPTFDEAVAAGRGGGVALPPDGARELALPAELPPGQELAAGPRRHDPRCAHGDARIGLPARCGRQASRRWCASLSWRRRSGCSSRNPYPPDGRDALAGRTDEGGRGPARPRLPRHRRRGQCRHRRCDRRTAFS